MFHTQFLSRTSILACIFVAVSLLFATISSSVVSPVEATGSIYHVNKSSAGGSGLSWATAFTDVQSALDTAVSGDQIWVAAGIYTPTERIDLGDARTATFSLTEGVSLYGGFAGGENTLSERDFHTNKTVLSGDIDGNDTTDADGVLLNHSGAQGSNAYHVIYSWQIADNTETRVDGFYITGGDANGSFIPGLECGYNCGGGIYNYDSHTNFYNLVLQGNYAKIGGGAYNNDSTSDYHNLLVVGNRAQSIGGGIKNTESDIQLINATLAGNTVQYNGGAGISNFRSYPQIVNSTIAFNYANNGAGGIEGENISVPVLVNTILWGNIDSKDVFNEIELDSQSSLDVSYSLIFGSTAYTGTSNITSTVSPFVQDASAGADGNWGTADDDYGDLTLVSSAAPIDAGNNGALPVDNADLDYDGNVVETIPVDLLHNGRISSGTVDIGAYEYQVVVLVTPTLSVSASDVSTTTLSWDDAYGCTVDVYHSGSPYVGYALVESDASSPYEMIYSGAAFYYLESNCASETAVSDKLGRFQFDVEPGS